MLKRITPHHVIVVKVLLLTKSVYPFHLVGGTERFYYNLARFLTREGVNVEVVSSGLGDNVKTIRRGHVKFTFIPPCLVNRKFVRVFHKLFDVNVARYILQRTDYDIIHGSAGLYTYAKLKKKPLILQVLELWDFPCCEHPNPLICAYTRALDYLNAHNAFQRADKVAVEVESEARGVCKLYGVPWSKIFYLPPGVDMEKIEEAIKTVDLAREDIGVDDADLVLICVSRLEPNKGVHILIEALKILNQRLNVKLVLVGTGSMEPLIKAMIRKYRLESKVKHFKNIPDNMLYKLYDLADIAVIPTLHEGLPTVLLEAMACGKPVIVSRTQETSCIVRNGDNGFLVRPGDPYAIVRAILEVYEKNLLNPLSARARSCAFNYSWRLLVKKVIKIYEDLCNKS